MNKNMEENEGTIFEDVPLESTIEIPESPPALVLEDLRTVLAIINTASTSGSFNGKQLTTVGRIHDKIAKFIAWNVAQQRVENNTQGNENGT